MSLTGVIARFKTGDYTVTRSANGTYVNGRLVAGAPSTFSIEASIQPVTGRELQALPEAYHGEEVKVIYTVTELLAAPTPDVVTIDGEAWEVFKCQRWQAFGGTHYRAHAARSETP